MAQALDLDGRKIAVAQGRVEGEQHLVPGRQVPLGPPRVNPPAFHEPVVTDVVGGPVAPRDLRGKWSVLGDQHVERDPAAVLVFPEDAEVARQALLQLVPGAIVEMDREPDGAGAERMGRAPNAVRAEPLAQGPVHGRERGPAAHYVDAGQFAPGHLVTAPARVAHGRFHRGQRLLDQRRAGVVHLVDRDHGVVHHELARVGGQ